MSINLFLDDCVANKTLLVQAKNNTMDNFKYPFAEAIIDIILDRVADNKIFITKYLDNQNFQNDFNNLLLPYVYEKLRKSLH